MNEPLSESSLTKAMEMFRADIEEVPEGKEWRLVYITHPRYAAEVQALMDKGLSQLEAMMIVQPMPGYTRMMLVDKKEPLDSLSSPV